MNIKKAELSINMIVIVAICLVVLVIMIFLVASRGRSLDETTRCTSMGGVCVDILRCNDPYALTNNVDVCASNTNQVCCKALDVR